MRSPFLPEAVCGTPDTRIKTVAAHVAAEVTVDSFKNEGTETGDAPNLNFETPYPRTHLVGMWPGRNALLRFVGHHEYEAVSKPDSRGILR